MQAITLQPPESVNVQSNRLNAQSGIPRVNGVTLMKNLVGVGIVAGLFAVVVPIPSAIAANDYERCTTDLLGTKITSEEAASACARAYFPRDLAQCVSVISGNTIANGNTIAAADALTACRQVRRPKEMATCVVDIRRAMSDSTAADVLDSCRRSLLPNRYSDCVVGLNKSAKIPPAKALDSCIDASYFPREVDPTFLPFAPTGGLNVTPGSTGNTMPSSNSSTPMTPAAPTNSPVSPSLAP